MFYCIWKLILPAYHCIWDDQGRELTTEVIQFIGGDVLEKSSYMDIGVSVAMLIISTIHIKRWLYLVPAHCVSVVRKCYKV